MLPVGKKRDQFGLFFDLSCSTDGEWVKHRIVPAPPRPPPEHESGRYQDERGAKSLLGDGVKVEGVVTPSAIIDKCR